MLWLLAKDKVTKLCLHLHHFEFRCKCLSDNCHYTLVSKKLIDSWYAMREESPGSIIITSGFRCQEHNKNIGSQPHSRHTTGCAIDIMPGVGVSMEVLIDLANRNFPYVLPYKDFIHCDVREP